MEHTYVFPSRHCAFPSFCLAVSPARVFKQNHRTPETQEKKKKRQKRLTKTWGSRKTDNVDYNSLKYEIKIHTRRDQARAMAIPGQSDDNLRRFEDGFYEELCRQHDRVGLFVTSKAAEISTRLGTGALFPMRLWTCGAWDRSKRRSTRETEGAKARKQE